MIIGKRLILKFLMLVKLLKDRLISFRFLIRSKRLIEFDIWVGRLVVWLAASLAGLVIVIFARFSEFAISLFFTLQNAHWWLPLVLTPLAGMLIVWVTRRWFVGAEGSGIPQTIAALHEGPTEKPIGTLISMRIAIGKVLLGVCGLAAGFSAGREGPSVQVAACVMHNCRHFLPNRFSVHPKHLILAGGAAGISATFNTPLAGIVFAIEELGRKFEQKTNGVVITAIVLSGLVSISIQGNYTYFGSLDVGTINRTIILPVIFCGFICGLLGGLFSRTLIEASSNFSGLIGTFRKLNPIWWAGFCGLIVALLGTVSNGTAHGSGYVFTKELLNGSITESWYYPVIKYLATIFTYLSGIPGGVFAPALSIGAGIAGDISPIFENYNLASAISALCMAGFLAAVTQAPITSFIIVMEMIDGHRMVISLMAVALISTITARLLSPPLYSTLAEKQLGKID